MNRRSIRVRLTAGYAVVLMATFAAAGGGAWLAMRDAIDDAVDDDLRMRVAPLQEELTQALHGEDLAQFSERLAAAEAISPTARFRVSDGTRWIYASAGTKDWEPPAANPAVLPPRGRARTLFISGQPIRILSARALVDSHVWALEVGVPIDELYEMLDTMAWTVVLATPLVLLFASAGGYWMSGRALEPVDRITRTAHAIGAQNLAERLPLRGSDDELDRLSETLNGMFARLDAAFQRVTQFTADASHELRTPVSIIRTTAELARRRPRSESEYADALDRILAESERTSRLIDDLLLLARADAGADGMISESMDLTDSLRDACDDAQVLARAAGVAFAAELPESCPMKGDSQAVRRLFLILLDNAVKYTPSGGSVRVTASSVGADAVVEVRDTGAGISAAELPHLFERFYRIGNDRSQATGGAGLGLSIAKWIASRHRGDISVESHPRAGSTFRVRLPLA